jgi:NAD(P)-dependent dehydrogenase (short-subunit alcohol dehydrogenase family)
MTKGMGQTGMMLGLDPETFLAQIASDTRLCRFADPDEIGCLCSYLAGDDSSFMTRSAILIDGGTAVVDVMGASIRLHSAEGVSLIKKKNRGSICLS